MNVFVFTASNKEAKQHLEDTIDKSVDETILLEHLPAKEFAELKQVSGGEYYCWGAVPGEGNIRNWGYIEADDKILSYWNYSYHHLARIIYKTRNKPLAKAIWGEDDNGNTWEYMYFLTKPALITPPLSSSATGEYLQSQFQGFARIKPEKTLRILNEFGSLENFIISSGSQIEHNNQPASMNQYTVKQLVDHVHAYTERKGFHYKREEIANFYLSMRTKPFVILAGISGTGKTQLPRKFAAALGFSDDQLIQLPVRPDWTDGSDLLGYTSLEGNFVPKELTLAIQKATSNENKPYFFILDEMNLARVEHYFSDFLSVIETRERNNNGNITTDPILREVTLLNARNRNDYQSLGWPSNLFLIGTVNMDETTHAFSKKVLDRANTIEMNEVNLNWQQASTQPLAALSGITSSYFQTDYLHASELTEEDKKGCNDNIKVLIEINQKLEDAGLHFGYRVRDEIAFYLVCNKKYNLIDERTAFDFQIVQKILPRIHGSSERIQKALVEILSVLENEEINSEHFDLLTLEKKWNKKVKFNYPKATGKILFMLKRFDEDRFTSFWL